MKASRISARPLSRAHLESFEIGFADRLVLHWDRVLVVNGMAGDHPCVHPLFIRRISSLICWSMYVAGAYISRWFADRHVEVVLTPARARAARRVVRIERPAVALHRSSTRTRRRSRARAGEPVDERGWTKWGLLFLGVKARQCAGLEL